MVNGSGDISVVKLAGYSYALITVGEGFGIDFSVRKTIAIFIGVAKMNLIRCSLITVLSISARFWNLVSGIIHGMVKIKYYKN